MEPAGWRGPMSRGVWCTDGASTASPEPINWCIPPAAPGWRPGRGRGEDGEKSGKESRSKNQQKCAVIGSSRTRERDGGYQDYTLPAKCWTPKRRLLPTSAKPKPGRPWGIGRSLQHLRSRWRGSDTSHHTLHRRIYNQRRWNHQLCPERPTA